MVPRAARLSALLSLLAAACTTSSRSTTPRGPGAPGASTTARSAASAVTPAITGRLPVIVVGLDGFRRSYFDTDSAPVLHALARTGVVSDGMIPSFPTVTFPNFYALATGLYPEHSGIVDNRFYDPSLHETFAMHGNAVREAKWWFGEPIWVTAQKHGERSGVYFWVGSEAPIDSMQPTYWKPYVGTVPFAARVQQVLQWVDLPPASRPALIMVYFQEPDHTGHGYGPDSPETRAAVLEVDRALGQLVSGLRARGVYDRVNLVVVADHGMSAISPKRTVYLDDVLNPADVNIIDLSPVLLIEARNGDDDALLAKLRTLPHVSAWPKSEVPARLHYGDSPRIPAIVGVADDGWMIALRHDTPFTARGEHGYDNANRSMRALFVAHGPAFRAGTTIPPFPNVDVYDLLAHLLDVPPAPNDGSLLPFEPALQSEPAAAR